MFYSRIRLVVVLVTALLVVSCFIAGQFHFSYSNGGLTDVRPIDVREWIEAHRDCPIMGIDEFQHLFPTVSAVEVPSLVIAVMSSSATKERIVAQMQGWANSVKNVFPSVHLFFSVDQNVPNITKEMTWIALDERAHPPTYEGAQWRSLLSLNESIHRAPNANWVFLVDDDTFVNTFALRQFLGALNPNIPAIYGYTFLHPKWNSEQCWLSGGAGVLLQRQAAVRVLPHIENCVGQYVGHYNDITIGCAAIRAGIPLVHSPLFSPDYNSRYDNHIDVYTMVTMRHISPRLQVEMFADLVSYRLSLGVPLETATLTQPSSQVLSRTSASAQSSSHYDGDWNDYRLGDGVMMFDRNGISNRAQVCERWPGSLLCEYLKQTAQANHVFVLAFLVNQWDIISGKNIERPSSDTTIIHLRLGDGLCGIYDLGSWRGSRCKGAERDSANARIPSCWENENDCFVNSDGTFYAYPKEYYEPVAAELLESVGSATRIVVFADPYHWTRNKDPRNGDYSIDFAYRDNLISFFLSKGFENIEIRHGSNPDDDFLYMSSAKNFVQGGGGFSRLIASVVTANGGRVFQPTRTSRL